MNTGVNRDSKVLTPDEMNAILKSFEVTDTTDLVLVARNPVLGKLRYQWAPVKTYLQSHCRPETNDCPDNVFDEDCTHFICHALNKAGVFVKLPSIDCQSGLCIRVNELAAAFSASTNRYSNVRQLSTHAETREGDYCFVPKWFGLKKEHAMVLADTASSTGARVYGHTNPRCGEFKDFEGEDCTYYRIEEATS